MYVALGTLSLSDFPLLDVVFCVWIFVFGSLCSEIRKKAVCESMEIEQARIARQFMLYVTDRAKLCRALS